MALVSLGGYRGKLIRGKADAGKRLLLLGRENRCLPTLYM